MEIISNNHKNNSTHYSLLKFVSILLLLVLGILFFFFFSFFPLKSSQSLITSQFFTSSQSLQCPPSHPNQMTTTMTLQNPKDELEETLERASMPNKTIIIAVINSAYVEGEVVPNMLDIFLEGFWAGESTRELINHLLVVAVDQTAYDRCVFRGLNCYRLVTDGVDFMGEKVYMSSEFIKMMWRRTLFLLDVLKRGYNFVFTDVDVIWLRNPFTILTTDKAQDFDFQISTDCHNGNSSSIRNAINTGFYFIKSNNKTISLFEKWYEFKDNSTGLKEQDVLQKLINQGVLTDFDINVRFLETKFISGFCQESSDIRSVLTVHANCCKYIWAKVSDLSKVLREWASFKISPSNETASFRWSSHVECKNSWSTSN